MSLLCGQHFRLRRVSQEGGEEGDKSPICDGKVQQKKA